MRSLLILFLLLICSPAFSYDYFPAYNNSDYFYGKGLVSIDGKAPVFDSTNDDSKEIAQINTNLKKLNIPHYRVKIENSFIAFSEDKNLALLPVKDDTDEWFYVCYNQAKQYYGWIKKSDNIDYMSWEDFLNVYGRKHGLYLFKNVGEKYKKLYSQPNDSSSLVDEFFVAKHIALWLISGDWVLVKVTTYDGKLKTGWLRWRLKDGSIIAFPDFNS